MNNKSRKEKIEEFLAAVKREYRNQEELWDAIKDFEGSHMMYERRSSVWCVGLELDPLLIEPKTEMYFKEETDGRLIYEDLDKIRAQLVSHLESHIDPKRVIEEVIKALDYSNLKEIEERVITKKEEVRPRRGCYALAIGRGKGSKELYICGGS